MNNRLSELIVIEDNDGNIGLIADACSVSLPGSKVTCLLARSNADCLASEGNLASIRRNGGAAISVTEVPKLIQQLNLLVQNLNAAIVFYDQQLLGLQEKKEEYVNSKIAERLAALALSRKFLVAIHSAVDSSEALVKSLNQKYDTTIFWAAKTITGVLDNSDQVKDQVVKPAIEEWNRRFALKLHDDSYINCALQTFLNPWDYKFVMPNKNAERWHWGHDCFEKGDTAYCKAIANWLDISQSDLDTESAKAIFRLGTNPFRSFGNKEVVQDQTWHLTDCWEDWYKDTKQKGVYWKCPKAIGKKTLKKLLFATGVLDICSNCVPVDIRAPIMPALPFFLSLRYFLSKLVEKKALIIKLEFSNSNTVSSLGITFDLGEVKTENPHYPPIPFGLGRRFSDSIRNAGSFTGLRRDLLNLTWCHIEGIKVDNDNLKIFKNLDSENKHQLPVPPITVQFAPHGILLMWS